MLIILAPARNVRPVACDTAPSDLLFPAQVAQLVGFLREYSPWQLESLLDVPPARAFILYDAWQAFDVKANGTPALLAFYGAAYRNMAPQDFTPAELSFAQRHLRILSALYGVLRPLDGVLEHRLGLKKDFSPGGRDLYAVWGDALYKELYASGETVVNLASAEYAKLVTPHMRPGDAMLTCRFLLDKPGGPKGTVSTVRAARGLMARFIVKNRIDRPEDLKGFDADGYRFAPGYSNNHTYVFVKRRAPSQAP